MNIYDCGRFVLKLASFSVLLQRQNVTDTAGEAYAKFKVTNVYVIRYNVIAATGDCDGRCILRRFRAIVGIGAQQSKRWPASVVSTRTIALTLRRQRAQRIGYKSTSLVIDCGLKIGNGSSVEHGPLYRRSTLRT